LIANNFFITILLLTTQLIGHAGVKVDGRYYWDVLLKQQILPVMRRIAGDTYVFQQDSAPAHRARDTVQLLQQETPEFIAPDLWPPNSPDLNPVAPVYKKGDRHLAENYRPISLTCVCCKILEHIICHHIHSHLDANDILSKFQRGFRSEYSCESQLILTVHDLMKHHNNRQQVDLAVLDFSKAFDMVPHERLLGKLHHYGINGPIWHWIRDFLTARTQCVVVDGECSSWTEVDSGVPQGTVLGPLLFLLHINDLPNCVSSQVRLFADECLVYRTISSVQDQLQLQRDLDSLTDWASCWGMSFNPSKCTIITISRSNSPLHKFYTLCGVVLQHVSEARYLGVLLSDDLQWSKHVQHITAKANSTLGLLRRNLHHCPEKLRELAYITLVRSRLEYCSAVWDPHKITDQLALESVQRRATRFTKRLLLPVQCVSDAPGPTVAASQGKETRDQADTFLLNSSG